MSIRSRLGRTGLTLIEIIVVIAIITIIVTITVAMGQHVIHANNRKATETLLESLASASDRYRIERGYWPWEEYSGGWERELTRTIEPPGSPNAGAVRIPYFTAGTPVLRQTRIDGSNNFDPASGGYLEIYDSWGNKIILNLPTSPLGLANQGMPVFQSPGSSGKFGSPVVYTNYTTETNVFQSTDNVFSHCGTDN